MALVFGGLSEALYSSIASPQAPTRPWAGGSLGRGVPRVTHACLRTQDGHVARAPWQRVA